MSKSPWKRIVFLKGETIEGSYPKTEAVIKGSLAIEEGCSPGEVLGTRAAIKPIDDNNDDL